MELIREQLDYNSGLQGVVTSIQFVNIKAIFGKTPYQIFSLML